MCVSWLPGFTHCTVLYLWMKYFEWTFDRFWYTIPLRICTHIFVSMDMYIIHVCLMRAVCFRVRMYICVMPNEIACICTHSVSRMYFFRFISLHQSHSITCNFYKFFLLIISFVNVIYGEKIRTVSWLLVYVIKKKSIMK